MRRCLCSLLLLCSFALGAAESRRYEVDYRVAFAPGELRAAASIEVRPGSGRLIALDLAMPADTYTRIRGDGSILRQGERVLWTVPPAGGALHYAVALDHRRDGGAYDSRSTGLAVITRGDRLFPPAAVRATRGSRSTATLAIELPDAWDDAETPYAKIGPNRFRVSDPRRRFDRPVGWIAAGRLSTVRETIAGTRVSIATPEGQAEGQLATMAVLRQTLPEMARAFGRLPDKLLIVRAEDPMWRGGLSARQSLWLHADRPLLSANGTSTLLHELTHVFTGIRGAAGDDWISEGIAEYYALEIARRTGLITADRHERSMQRLARESADVAQLQAPHSTRDRTRKAVGVFAALDDELRRDGEVGLDALTRKLMRRDEVALATLRKDAAAVLGRPSQVLLEVR